MEVQFIDILAFITAYLIGSLAPAVWIGKIFFGLDIRNYGSGNAGATNTFRILGKSAGIAVLTIDILKGWIAVNLSYFIGTYQPGNYKFVNLQIALAIAAILGHIFPIYVKFKGGKGIATLLGTILAIYPKAALISIIAFILVWIFTQYVSLASIIASLLFPFYVIVVDANSSPSMSIFSIAVAILVLITHQKNIERLLRKEENKTSPFKKKEKK